MRGLGPKSDLVNETNCPVLRARGSRPPCMVFEMFEEMRAGRPRSQHLGSISYDDDSLEKADGDEGKARRAVLDFGS